MHDWTGCTAHPLYNLAQQVNWPRSLHSHTYDLLALYVATDTQVENGGGFIFTHRLLCKRDTSLEAALQSLTGRLNPLIRRVGGTQVNARDVHLFPETTPNTEQKRN
jgi:hypothetical protein